MSIQSVSRRKPGPGRPKRGRTSLESIQATRLKRAKERAAVFAALPDDALADVAMFCIVMTWSRTTFYRRQAAGLLPAPVNHITGSKRWRVGDIRALLAGGKE